MFFLSADSSFWDENFRILYCTLLPASQIYHFWFSDRSELQILGIYSFFLRSFPLLLKLQFAVAFSWWIKISILCSVNVLSLLFLSCPMLPYNNNISLIQCFWLDYFLKEFVRIENMNIVLSEYLNTLKYF